MITKLGWGILTYLLLVALFLDNSSSLFSTTASAQPRALGAEPETSVPPTDALDVLISTSGLSQNSLTVSMNTTVTWINDTMTNQILVSGVPYRVYLPEVVNQAGSGSASAGAIRTGAATSGPVSFGATIAPNGSYSYRFDQPGTYPYYFANNLSLSGEIVVVAGISTPTLTSTSTASPTSTAPIVPGTNTPTSTTSPTATASPTPTTITSTSGLPPDPASVAPPLDPSVATNVFAATQFLYTGNNPIQTGVVSGTIQLQRAAVLRGRALDGSGNPLPGVTITILNHPEFGQTLSRIDGMFDLAVNGGGVLTVNYQKPGYFPAQRQVQPSWQDFTWLPDVALIQGDPNVTAIDTSGSNGSEQVARGSQISDADGTRQATLLFAPYTTAQLQFQNGSSQALSTVHLRATEYTVGDLGPAAMPGQLPQSTAYTYAVAFSADELGTSGATSIQFSQPVVEYTEDFLGFLVGQLVPVGRYDSTKGAWIPEANGLIVQILDMNGPNGEADLDVDGQGKPATATEYQNLGISDSERLALASLYSNGQKLWRVPIGQSLSASGSAVPSGSARPAETDAVSVPLTSTPTATAPARAAAASGPGLIQRLERGLSGYFGAATTTGRTGVSALLQAASSSTDTPTPTGTAICQTGSPTATPTASPTVTPTPTSTACSGFPTPINPLDTDTPTPTSTPTSTATSTPTPTNTPTSTNTSTNTPTPTQTNTDTPTTTPTPPPAQPWDFNWGAGPPPGSLPPQQPTPRPGSPADKPCQMEGGPDPLDCQNQAFAYDLPIAGTTYHLHYQSDQQAGNTSADSLFIPLSGATVPPNLEAIDLIVQVAGQQFVQSFPPNPNQSYTFVWNGLDAYGRPVSGKQPVKVQVGYVYPLVYLDPGTLNSLAAASVVFGHFTYDAAPATGIRFSSAALSRTARPAGVSAAMASTMNTGRGEVALWQDWSGSLGNDKLPPSDLGGWTVDVHQRYDPSGHVLYSGDGSQRSAEALPAIIKHVAGNGTQGFAGDGGPAAQAELNWPAGVAVGPDGSVYIVDSANERIRKVDPSGTITTFAGGGTNGADGIPATQASLDFGALPWSGIAVGPDGSVYIAETRFIRRVSPQGIISTVAGNGGFCNQWSPTNSCGDGGPARQASLNPPAWLAVGPDGSLYFTDNNNELIREVDPSGIISTIAGTGQSCTWSATSPCGDGGPARQASFRDLNGLALGPDGSIYIADNGNNLIRMIGTNGIISTLAGNGSACIWTNGSYYQAPNFCGDGGPATQAGLDGPFSLAVGPDGSIYFFEPAVGSNENDIIRKVDSTGTISTIAGNGNPYTGNGDPFSTVGDASWACVWDDSPGPYFNLCDGEPASQTALGISGYLGFGPDGDLYIADGWAVVSKISLALPSLSQDGYLIPSVDGSEVYAFDSFGRHVRTYNALTGATDMTFGYDAAGRLATITDANGNVTTIQRDANGHPTAIVAPFDQTTTLAVDANGYLAQVSDPAGDSYRFSSTAGGLITSVVDPNGNQTTYRYDAQERLVQESAADGYTLGLNRVEDTTGYTVTLTTGLGRSTSFAVQDAPGGGTAQTATNSSGLSGNETVGTNSSDATTFASGQSVTIQSAGDPRFGLGAPIPQSLTINTPGGLSFSRSVKASATLQDPGNPLSLTQQTHVVTVNSRVYTSTFSVNAGTYTFTDVSAAGRTMVTTADSQRRPVQIQAFGLAPADYTYDPQGRVASETTGSGATARTTTYQYDPTTGALASYTNPLNEITRFSYDLAGRLISEILPSGATASFGYDAVGNLVSVTPPGQSAYRYTYTSGNLPASFTAPDTGNGLATWTYSYDTDRDLTQVNRPDGSVARYSYDGGGRMSAISVSQGAVTDTVSYSYSPTTGNLSAISASNGVNTAFSYDGGLLTGVTWSGPVAGSVTYRYNNDFALTSLGVDGSTVSFAYDPDGLLTQAGALNLTYSPQNLLVTSATLGSLSDSWTYDSFGAPTSYRAVYNGTGGPTTLYTESESYDALGRVSSASETLAGSAITTTYQYDGDGRLTSVATNGTPIASYTYDTNGNRLTATDASNVTTSGTYNARDELTAYGATRYAYSPTGDLLTKSTGALTTTYAYDGFDHLQSVTLPNGTVISYLIDGLGRRVGKLVNGTLTQGFLYQSGWRPVAELDGSGKVISRFVYGPRLTAPEYFVQGGVTYRIITDRRGSVRLVVNAATGEVAEQIDYDPFGNVLKDTNPGFQPFGFAGGLYDSDTGLVHFGAREYDPTIGRWTTPDPQLFAGGDTNLYTYVRNDPVNLVDPTGSNGAAGGAEGWFMDTLTDAATEVGSGAARSGPENQIKQNLESLGADPEYAEAIASMLNDGISGAAGGAVAGSEFGPGGSLLGAGIGTIVNTTISVVKSDVHAFNELMQILHENEERDRMNREMKQRLLDRQSGLCGPGAPSPAPFSGSPLPYENPAMTSNPNYSGQQTPLPYGFYGSE